MRECRIQSKVLGSINNPNCKYTCLLALQLLVLKDIDAIWYPKKKLHSLNQERLKRFAYIFVCKYLKVSGQERIGFCRIPV